MLSKQILIVEDEFNTRFAVDFALNKAGYLTVQARDGQEALDIVQQHAGSGDFFDLLVTDFQMPGMNGLELIDELRRIRPGLPVLVITGFGDKKLLIELLRRGPADYLDKPFSPDDLGAAVARILTRAEHERSLAAHVPEKYIKTDRQN